MDDPIGRREFDATVDALKGRIKSLEDANNVLFGKLTEVRIQVMGSKIAFGLVATLTSAASGAIGYFLKGH